jgi:hypothetical protein
MATHKAHGKELLRIEKEVRNSEGTIVRRIQYSFHEDRIVLQCHSYWETSDYAKPHLHSFGWKRKGMIYEATQSGIDKFIAFHKLGDYGEKK